jgi:excisionase family DNA binding protein
VTEILVSTFSTKLLDELIALIETTVSETVATNSTPTKWLTTAEAAEHLRLSETAVRKRAQRGTLPAHRDGSRLLFNRAELDNRVTLVSRSTNWGERRGNGPAPWPQED